MPGPIVIGMRHNREAHERAVSRRKRKLSLGERHRGKEEQGTRADSERVHCDSEEIKNRFPEEKKQDRGENDTDRHAAGEGPLHPRFYLFSKREKNRENEERGEQKEKLDINRDGC